MFDTVNWAPVSFTTKIHACQIAALTTDVTSTKTVKIFIITHCMENTLIRIITRCQTKNKRYTSFIYIIAPWTPTFPRTTLWNEHQSAKPAKSVRNTLHCKHLTSPPKVRIGSTLLFTHLKTVIFSVQACLRGCKITWRILVSTLHTAAPHLTHSFPQLPYTRVFHDFFRYHTNKHTHTHKIIVVKYNSKINCNTTHTKINCCKQQFTN